MRKNIHYTLLFFIIVFGSCTGKTENSQSDNLQNKNALLSSIKILAEATDKMNQLSNSESNIDISDSSQLAKLSKQQAFYIEALNEIEEGIKESDKVSDNYLDNIHPEMKTMYRDNFIGSYKLTLSEQATIMKNTRDKGPEAFTDKNYLDSARAEHAKVESQIKERQLSWYNFVKAHQDILNDEEVLEGKKNDKSYWGMLWRFGVADIIATILVSLLIVLLMLPVAGLSKLIETMKTSTLAILAVSFSFIAGFVQLYFWVLWAAFCVFHISYYMDSPDVKYRWVYYLTGFIAAGAPMSYLSSMEQDTAKTNKEKNTIAFGSSIYILCTIIAFILFCFYPNLMEYKFISFINDWLKQH